MRKITAAKIQKVVSDLCIEANTALRPDIVRALKRVYRKERNKLAQKILRLLMDNAVLAREKGLAICQDTGMTVVFLRIGQKLQIRGGGLFDAVNRGVKDGYRKGHLRKSVVDDPILRNNTKTNTPCIIHADIVKGDRLKITVSPKGFGSENKSALKMFNPTDSLETIGRFIIETVKKAGPDACPPFVVGVGMGGTFEGAAILAKKALARPIHMRNKKRHIAGFERVLLKKINALKIGSMGLGGSITALGINIEVGPTHIAGLPVAVNMSCHATRQAEAIV